MSLDREHRENPAERKRFDEFMKLFEKPAPDEGDYVEIVTEHEIIKGVCLGDIVKNIIVLEIPSENDHSPDVMLELTLQTDKGSQQSIAITHFVKPRGSPRNSYQPDDHLLGHFGGGTLAINGETRALEYTTKYPVDAEGIQVIPRGIKMYHDGQRYSGQIQSVEIIRQIRSSEEMES